MIIGAILKNVLSGGTKSNDSKAMRPRSRGDAARDNRSRDMIDTLRRNNERSNNKSAGTGSYARKGAAGAAGASRGPTVAQQVAARAAAKLKAKKAKGQDRRKKYEAAETMAKKMKLIFVD